MHNFGCTRRQTCANQSEVPRYLPDIVGVEALTDAVWNSAVDIMLPQSNKVQGIGNLDKVVH